MATITNFEELEIWKEARRLNLLVFQLIQSSVNAKQDFKFKDQIKAATGSVMDNIAEGFERDSRLEFVNFLSIAKGSVGEIRSQLIRGFDMNYWTEENVVLIRNDYEILAKNIGNFIRYLNNTEIKGQKFKDRK